MNTFTSSDKTLIQWLQLSRCHFRSLLSPSVVQTLEKQAVPCGCAQNKDHTGSPKIGQLIYNDNVY